MFSVRGGAAVRRVTPPNATMNAIRRLIFLPVLALAASALAEPSPQLPDRPAAALSKYKDNWVPVVGADGNVPVVSVGGSEVVLEGNSAIILSVGDHFADGFVTVTDVDLADIPPSTDAEEAATTTNLQATREVFKASLVSDIDVPNAYAIVVGSPPGQKPDSQPTLAVRVSRIGDLQAGKLAHISVAINKLSGREEPKWSVLVFSGGRQVRSSGMSEVMPAYFDRVENQSLKRRIAERVAKGTDAQVAAFRQLPLGIPDAVKAKYHGTTVNVTVSFSAEGRVVSAVPVGSSDPELAEAVGRGFGTWLFLPPVKAGAAVASSAIIPLKM